MQLLRQIVMNIKWKIKLNKNIKQNYIKLIIITNLIKLKTKNKETKQSLGIVKFKRKYD